MEMTLRGACIEKTCALLMNGAWEGCAENPIQCLPTTVVQELLSRIRLEGSEGSIAHYRLLLTSGRLEHAALPTGLQEEQFVALLQMLCRGCRNLRTLSVRCSCVPTRNVAVPRALRKVLLRSTKLQLLHTGILFSPEDIRNCSDLRTVMLHFVTEEEVVVFLHRITSDLWKGPFESQPLRSVEVLAMCCNISSFHPSISSFLISKIAMLLENCPQLMSLGFIESSLALKELHDRGLGVPRSFQLRRAFWRVEKYVGRFEYCDVIRAAAESCPHLEVLIIQVCLAGDLRHLKTLSNLTCLIVYFTEYEDDPWREFYSLLTHIGHQLRHLSVYKGGDGKSLNVSAVCGSCPNLSTLQIFCSGSVEEELSLPSLERLSTSIPTRSLLPLLSSCPLLKVLCLDRLDCLEDFELQSILLKNSFAKLEVALIYSCFLSKSGLKRFVQSASRLRLCCLGSYVLRDWEVKRCVRDANPSVLCHSPYDFNNLKDKYFPRTLFTQCWL